MDTIEISIITKQITGDLTVDPVNFFINGRNLIDIIRDAEMPFNSRLAGNYIGIHPGEFYSDYKDSVPGKIYLLQCPGYDTIGCWPLLARVTI